MVVEYFFASFQVIAAEGEQKASQALKEASIIISESSSALQLRYLQVFKFFFFFFQIARTAQKITHPLPDLEFDFGGEELYDHFPASN